MGGIAGGRVAVRKHGSIGGNGNGGADAAFYEIHDNRVAAVGQGIQIGCRKTDGCIIGLCIGFCRCCQLYQCLNCIALGR